MYDQRIYENWIEINNLYCRVEYMYIQFFILWLFFNFTGIRLRKFFFFRCEELDGHGQQCASANAATTSSSGLTSAVVSGCATLRRARPDTSATPRMVYNPISCGEETDFSHRTLPRYIVHKMLKIRTLWSTILLPSTIRSANGNDNTE